MNFKESSKLLIEIKSQIEIDSEKGYKHFIKVWEKLDGDSKRLLKYPILKICYEAITANPNITEIKVCYQAVLLYLDDENPVENRNLKFNLTSSINDVDVAKLFYTLKNRGYISNTLEELSEIISNVFGLNDNTIFSYLSDPQKMAKAKLLIS